MHNSIRLYLEYAAYNVDMAKGFDRPAFKAMLLGDALHYLRRALAMANRHARHLRSSIMRALNFARAALRNISK